MFTNFLKNKLKNNKVTLGTWLTISDADFSEIFAKYLDFLIIDTEHGNFDNKEIVNIIRACELYKCSPIIRVAKNSSDLILSALDLGAHGIITPKVENELDLSKIIDSMYYAPLGKRGFSGFVRSFNYDLSKLKINPSKMNSNILNIALIESKEGLRNLESLCKSKYVDIIYLGYYDLSQDLGLDLKKDWNKILKILKNAISIISKNKKSAGIMALNNDHLKIFKKFKASFIPYLVDASLLEKQLDELKVFFNKIT